MTGDDHSTKAYRQLDLAGKCPLSLNDRSAWNQISAVTHQLCPDNHYIFISGKDGSRVNYTPYDIFRYRKVARLIATRANVPLTELAPVKTSPVERPAATS